MVENIKHNEEEEGTDVVTPKILDSDGLKSIDASLAYIEQKEECTPYDILVIFLYFIINLCIIRVNPYPRSCRSELLRIIVSQLIFLYF